MSKILIPAYWPFFKTPELRRFDYTAIDGSMPPLTSVFSYSAQTDSMLYSDYDSAGTLKDIWYYQYRPGFGVAEWRDDYPATSTSGAKKVVLSPPIGWSEFLAPGGSYINYPKMDLFRSWPPACASGVQMVVLEEHLAQFTSTKNTYKDVIQFTYLQSWSGKPATGARYWMALGVGPVAQQWLAQDPSGPTTKPLIETARMDAVITSVGVNNV